MTVGTKLGLGFGLTLGILLAIGWTVHKSTRRLIDDQPLGDSHTFRHRGARAGDDPGERSRERGAWLHHHGAGNLSLADQSKKATLQIRRILSDIQRATHDVVLTIERSSKSVNEAADVVAQTGDTIRVLSEIIADSARAASQIATSANQQSMGTAQIHQAMTDINRATNQNLSATRQMEQAAKDLLTLGGKLCDELDGGARPQHASNCVGASSIKHTRALCAASRTDAFSTHPGYRSPGQRGIWM